METTATLGRTPLLRRVPLETKGWGCDVEEASTRRPTRLEIPSSRFASAFAWDAVVRSASFSVAHFISRTVIYSASPSVAHFISHTVIYSASFTVVHSISVTAIFIVLSRMLSGFISSVLRSPNKSLIHSLTLVATTPSFQLEITPSPPSFDIRHERRLAVPRRVPVLLTPSARSDSRASFPTSPRPLTRQEIATRPETVPSWLSLLVRRLLDSLTSSNRRLS